MGVCVCVCNAVLYHVVLPYAVNGGSVSLHYEIVCLRYKYDYKLTEVQSVCIPSVRVQVFTWLRQTVFGQDLMIVKDEDHGEIVAMRSSFKI